MDLDRAATEKADKPTSRRGRAARGTSISIGAKFIKTSGATEDSKAARNEAQKGAKASSAKKRKHKGDTTDRDDASPKRISKKTTSKSNVTPSPKTKTGQGEKLLPATSSWTEYDSLLRGDPFCVPPDYGKSGIQFDRLWNGLLTDGIHYFRLEVEGLLRDPLFTHPFGVIKLSQYDRRWRQYAFELSKYPSDRLQAVGEEHQKDMKLHDDLLKHLMEEINEKRHGGKRYYLRALNCIFFDSFNRCGVPLPPLPEWNVEVDTKDTVERKTIYKKQLSAWIQYRARVFALFPIAMKHSSAHEGDKPMGTIQPLTHRGEMQPRKAGCFNEESIVSYHYKTAVKEENEKKTDEQQKAPGDDLLDRPACPCTECLKMFDIMYPKTNKEEGNDDDDGEKTDEEKGDNTADWKCRACQVLNQSTRVTCRECHIYHSDGEDD